MPRNDLLAAASFYIAKGWHVFVLGPNKRPVANCAACRDVGPEHDAAACGHVYCHGFYSASLSLDRFADQLDATPDGMIAIRTGAVSGVVAIDIDTAHGGRIDPVLMPRTLASVTGSIPAGAHLFYAHPRVIIPNSQSLISPGVDVRGDGGYVVASPSIHPKTGREYVWGPPRPIVEMPSALIAACVPKPAAATSARSTSTTAAEGISSPERLLASILATVEQAPEGKRRTTLYGASRGVARMVAAGALTTSDAIHALTLAGHTAGQSARETNAAILGGFQAEGVAA